MIPDVIFVVNVDMHTEVDLYTYTIFTKELVCIETIFKNLVVYIYQCFASKLFTFNGALAIICSIMVVRELFDWFKVEKCIGQYTNYSVHFSLKLTHKVL